MKELPIYKRQDTELILIEGQKKNIDDEEMGFYVCYWEDKELSIFLMKCRASPTKKRESLV